ncbi:hypothetical protein MASR2M15_01170 [Anaerolineales bacterium]
MKFQKGTAVKTANGDKVGTIDQIVIDPATNEVTHIVVKKGFLFTEDRVIPIESLHNTDTNTVTLNRSVNNLEEYPLYEEKHYFPLPTEDPSSSPRADDGVSGPLYYYPPVGVEPYTNTGLAYPAVTGVYASNAVERDVRNIPADNIVVNQGTSITTSDGKHAGDVQQIFTNSNGRITHILISKGFLFPEERLIPITWVRRMNDTELQLSVPIEIVQDLPEHSTTT